MTRRASRPCNRSGCPHVAHKDGQCQEHYRQQQRRLDQQRPSSTARGYDILHRQWRAQVLTRDPICKQCGEAPATEADHIIPINQGGGRYDLSNGQGLCKPCHSRKTAKEDGGFGQG